MADPRLLNYDPTTQIATVADAAGQPRQVHRSGLQGPLAPLGMEADAMGASSPAAPPSNTFQGGPSVADLEAAQARQQTDAVPFQAAPQVGGLPGGTYVPDGGQLGSGVMPTVGGVPGRADATPAASAEASPASGATDASGFVFRDPARAGAGGANPYLTGQQPRYMTTPSQTLTNTSAQTQQRLPLSGEARELSDRADSANVMQQNAAIASAPGQQEMAERTAVAANDQASLMERAAAERQQRLATREAERERLMTEANDLINASKEEIDPKRLLGSAGNRVLAAISVALGAAGSAVTGTPNYALQIINDAIERDIAAQKENRTSKAEAARGKLSALQLAGQLSDDEMTQRDIATAAQLGAVEQVARGHAARLGAENVPNELTALIAGLQAQGVELQAKIAQSLGDQAVINTTERQVGGRTIDMGQRYAQAQGAEVYTPERAGEMVPRAGGYHPDDTVRRELTKIGQQYGTMQDAIHDIRREVADASSSVPGTESRKKLEQSVRLLQRLVGGNALLELGVPSANDAEVQAAVAGDVPTVTDRLRGNGAVVFENLGRILTSAEQGQYRDRGVIPLQDLPPLWESRRAVPVESVTGQSRGRRAATDFQEGY